MKKLLKRIALLSAAALLAVSFAGCKNLQKLEKEKYKEDVDIAVSAEPTSIYALEAEIKEIAYRYDEGGILTQSIAVFDGDNEIGAQKGTLYFTFCREDQEANLGTIVILTYDMFDKKVTKVSYEQGVGQFTATTKEPISEDIKAITFNDLFEKIIPQDASFHDKLKKGENIKLTIEFTSKGIEPSLI